MCVWGGSERGLLRNSLKVRVHWDDVQRLYLDPNQLPTLYELINLLVFLGDLGLAADAFLGFGFCALLGFLGFSCFLALAGIVRS